MEKLYKYIKPFLLVGLTAGVLLSSYRIYLIQKQATKLYEVSLSKLEEHNKRAEFKLLKIDTYMEISDSINARNRLNQDTGLRKKLE